MGVSFAIPTLLGLLMVLQVVSGEAQVCSILQTVPLVFNGNSHRNATGHWIMEASVMLDAASCKGDCSGGSPWTYVIEFNRIDCGQGERMVTNFRASVPPSWSRTDYTLTPGIGYHKLHTENRSWKAAKEACEEEGAHLAVINSLAEQKALAKLMSGYQIPDYYVWIGVNDIEKNGLWVTVLGDTLKSVGYVSWRPGQPENRGGEDCGCVFRENAELEDCFCHEGRYFICEHHP